MQIPSERNWKIKGGAKKTQKILFADIQTEQKAIKTRMNNAKEGMSDVEDRKMEITQSGQQTEN